MTVRRIARAALVATPLPEIVLRFRAARQVTVLGYHRVLPPLDPDYPFNEGVVSATPEEFARELRHLRDNLDVISMPQLVAGIRNPSLLPPRPAVITFDDGYADNFTYALPQLKEFGLPACFFVCTGLIGTRMIPWYEAWVCCLKRSRRAVIESPFGADDHPYQLGALGRTESIRRFRKQVRKVPWSRVPTLLNRLREATDVDPTEHLDKPLFMDWDALKTMAAAGMDIGGHTQHHPMLSRVDDARVLREEISGCHQDLTVNLSRRPLAFAYPWGDLDAMSDTADAEIERSGFEISFSFIHGFAPRQPDSARRLPRVHTSAGDDHRAFRFRLATAPAPTGGWQA